MLHVCKNHGKSQVKHEKHIHALRDTCTADCSEWWWKSVSVSLTDTHIPVLGQVYTSLWTEWSVRHANLADTKPRENNFRTWLFSGWMLKSSDSKINTIKLKETGQWYDKHEWQVNQKWHVSTMRWKCRTGKSQTECNAKNYWLKEDPLGNECTIMYVAAVQICFLNSFQDLEWCPFIFRTKHPFLYEMVEFFFQTSCRVAVWRMKQKTDAQNQSDKIRTEWAEKGMITVWATLQRFSHKPVITNYRWINKC